MRRLALLHQINLQNSLIEATINRFARYCQHPTRLTNDSVHAVSACGSVKRKKSSSEARCRGFSNISILSALESTQSRRMAGCSIGSSFTEVHESAMANRRDVVTQAAQFFRQHVNHVFSLR
jgi:hypothetical protein